MAGIDTLSNTGFREAPRLFGVVLQDPDRQLAMPTPWDEVSFVLENLGYGEDEVSSMTERALARFGLLEKAHEHVENLSGGEKRRLTLASAVVHGPQLLILDEPTASVDPWGVGEIKRFVREMRRAGVVVVIIEHKIRYFLDEADRLLVLSEGEVYKSLRLEDPLDRETTEDLVRLGVDARLSVSVSERDERPRGDVVLEVDSLDIGYEKERPLIKDVSFDVREGEVVALVGPNGSGKTTLLKTIAGLLRPLGGSIKVRGRDVGSMKRGEIHRHIFYVPQEPDYLFVETTLSRELSVAARMTGRRPEDLAGLVPWYHRLSSESPYRLSLGQRRWVSVVIGWSYSPGLLLLDEPTSGLDYRLYRELSVLVERLRSRRTSFIIATHDPRVVGELADRVLLVSSGRLRETTRGEALSILENTSAGA